jgi:hypothetical protein
LQFEDAGLLLDFLVVARVGTGATFTTLTTLATLGTVSTLRTLGTLRARTALALNITLGFLEEDTARELVLSSLGVNFQKFNLKFIAFLDTCLFDCFQSLPINFANVQEAVLARHELYETTVGHY